ncbi:unnamed protein product, partial [Didymodactylos carnosus]
KDPGEEQGGKDEQQDEEQGRKGEEQGGKGEEQGEQQGEEQGGNGEQQGEEGSTIIKEELGLRELQIDFIGVEVGEEKQIDAVPPMMVAKINRSSRYKTKHQTFVVWCL